MWISKLRVFRVFQSNLSILSFRVTSASSFHLPSIFFLLLYYFSPLLLKRFPLCFLRLGTPGITKQLKLAISKIKNYRVSSSVSSLVSAEELWISNTILISVDYTMSLLVCFELIYIYIFIELEGDFHVFSQPAWLTSSSTRNFTSRLQLCFDFAMQYGSLCCPFKVSYIKRFLKSVIYLKYFTSFNSSSMLLNIELLNHLTY